MVAVGVMIVVVDVIVVVVVDVIVVGDWGVKAP